MQDDRHTVTQLTTTIDPASQLVQYYFHTVKYELYERNIELSDYRSRAVKIILSLGYEYFSSAWLVIVNKQVLGAGALVRTALENLIDMQYIERKQKYAKSYIDSMNQLQGVFRQARFKSQDDLIDSRELQKANPWTNASIEDRIKAVDRPLVIAYDIYSYFGHPNPGAMAYLAKDSLRKGQLSTLKYENCIIAIGLMKHAIKRCDLQSVTVCELTVLGDWLLRYALNLPLPVPLLVGYGLCR